jgi:hypothetical protein
LTAERLARRGRVIVHERGFATADQVFGDRLIGSRLVRSVAGADLDRNQSSGTPSRRIKTLEESAMTESLQGTGSIVVTKHDLRRLLGDIEERKLLDILALNPSIAEIEEAAVWAAGNGDILAKSGHPLSGTVADVVEIVLAGEEEEEERPPAS